MNELHLIRMNLDRRLFLRLSSGKGVDESYALHAGLAAMFAESNEPADVPFLTYAVDDERFEALTWKERDDTIPLLAYSDIGREALMKRIGKPEVVQSLVSTNKMSLLLKSGMGLRFQTRVCPIVRSRRGRDGKPMPTGKGGRPKHREVDAFIHARITDPEAARDEVYLSWLKTRIGDAAHVEKGALFEYREQRMSRRAGTRMKEFMHPNALLRGELVVGSSSEFEALLRQGIGRHKAFGFGMLLVRPL